MTEHTSACACGGCEGPECNCGRQGDAVPPATACQCGADCQCGPTCRCDGCRHVTDARS